MSEKGAQRSGINKSLMWLRKVLQITEPTDTPDRVSPLLQPVIDVFGWDVPFTLIEHVTTVAAGVTTTTRLPAPPDGEAHYYIACSISHDDPTDRVISVQIENQTDNQTALTTPNATAIAAGFDVALHRPFLVPAGSQLMGVSTTAIAVTENFTIRGMFIRLDAGEYLGASPYG